MAKGSNLAASSVLPKMPTLLSTQGSAFRQRQSFAHLNNVEQIWKKWVISVDQEKSVVAVGPATDQSNFTKFTQLVLDGGKGKSTHPHQLADITLLLRNIEKQSQQLRAHFGK